MFSAFFDTVWSNTSYGGEIRADFGSRNLMVMLETLHFD